MLMPILHSEIYTEELRSFFTRYCKKENQRNFKAPAYTRLPAYTLITLSAFSFAAVNYQLSIVSTHFVQRQQTSTYGMISYTFAHLSRRSPFDIVSVRCVILLIICISYAITRLLNGYSTLRK